MTGRLTPNYTPAIDCIRSLGQAARTLQSPTGKEGEGAVSSSTEAFWHALQFAISWGSNSYQALRDWLSLKYYGSLKILSKSPAVNRLPDP